MLEAGIKKILHEGTVIPAHPLALNKYRQLDEKRQRGLTRYYMSSGAGGVAIGVHTTQFAIHDPEINLYEDVLAIAADEISHAKRDTPFIKIAGICGPTDQAMAEAEKAVKNGYHLGLLSMGGLKGWSEKEILKRTEEVSRMIPLFGFYLQPSVGGRIFSFDFWEGFAAIENVHAIKVAAFNRYQTLDVMRAVCFSDRCNEIAMYTGNDDNIIVDLLTSYRFTVKGKERQKRFVGGLLGHWAVWTQKAVALLEEIRSCRANKGLGLEKLLTKANAVTDMNAAIFDSKNGFHGCIPGIHEVLQRQGLLEGRWCLNPMEDLSVGQLEEIHRVYNYYPELTDDPFVKAFLREEQRSFSM